MRLIIGPVAGTPRTPEQKAEGGARNRKAVTRYYGIPDPDEETLLRLLSEAEGGSSDMLLRAWFVLGGLHGIATRASLPVLERALFYRRQDIKLGALGLIGPWNGEPEGPPLELMEWVIELKPLPTKT